MHALKHLFTIQEISLKLNISKSTLRFWEKEFDGILKPQRTLGGQRRYTPNDIALIKEIHNLRKQGQCINEIKMKLLNSGNLKIVMPEFADFDLLVERVATAVKNEICRFLKSAEKEGLDFSTVEYRDNKSENL